ncbi:MAG: cobalamin-binding protein [Chloroflexi bacterium]|nr:cobalamin-binding protein [Chloroflexota bacterium]
MTLEQELHGAVIAGDADEVKRLTAQALQDGLNADYVLNGVLIPAMSEVGRLFEQHEFFVPEMLVSARAMKYGVEILRPHLVDAGLKPIGTVVIGTVAGDLHDIGKNLVIMMLEGTGFRVVDLGVDVATDRFVQAVQEQRPQVLGMSALLTTTMLTMAKVIEALQKAGLRDQVMVMVGGAPLTERFAREIGADLYAADASAAAREAKAAVERS